MVTTQSRSLVSRARAAIAHPVELETFFAKLSPKDRQNIERHLVAVDANPLPNHGNVYRKLVATLFTLAPHPAKTIGQQSILFFIPDGKYRMQVFAVHDMRDAKISIFTGNMLQEALDAGFLKKPARGEEPDMFHLANSSEILQIEQLDGASLERAPYFKDMLGWNRKALRITLPTTATADQIEATELLAAMTSLAWATTPA